MNTCWTCLVILDQDATACPFCGADQRSPEATVVLEPEKPRDLVSLVRRWGVVAMVVGCTLVTLLLWLTLREPAADPVTQAEAQATRALFDIRAGLSDSALRSGDKYPSTLESLGNQTVSLIEAARNAGYEVIYEPQPSRSDGSIKRFVLRARTENANYRNFYLDESGQMRATSESRPANLQDPPI